MTGAGDSHEAGFTLLETIIAFLILAISLTLGVETISQGAKTFQRSADVEKATLILHGLAAGPLFKIADTGVISGKAELSGWKFPSPSFRYNLSCRSVSWFIRCVPPLTT